MNEANRDRTEVQRLRGELLAARMTITELQERCDDLERRTEAEKASAASLLQQLRDMRNSRSWKITAPMRNVIRRVRG